MPLPKGPCGALLSSILGLTPFTGIGGGGISLLQQTEGERETPSHTFTRRPVGLNQVRGREATRYLSLSLGGPEERGGGGPAVSGLPTGKPAPKLVI